MDQSNNITQTLSELYGIAPEEGRETLSDYDNFMIKIQHKVYIQSFVDLYLESKINNEDLYDEVLQDYINHINLEETDLSKISTKTNGTLKR